MTQQPYRKELKSLLSNVIKEGEKLAKTSNDFARCTLQRCEKINCGDKKNDQKLSAYMRDLKTVLHTINAFQKNESPYKKMQAPQTLQKMKINNIEDLMKSERAHTCLLECQMSQCKKQLFAMSNQMITSIITVKHYVHPDSAIWKSLDEMLDAVKTMQRELEAGRMTAKQLRSLLQTTNKHRQAFLHDNL